MVREYCVCLALVDLGSIPIGIVSTGILSTCISAHLCVVLSDQCHHLLDPATFFQHTTFRSYSRPGRRWTVDAVAAIFGSCSMISTMVATLDNSTPLDSFPRRWRGHVLHRWALHLTRVYLASIRRHSNLPDASPFTPSSSSDQPGAI